MEFNKKIKARRLELGLTTDEVAKLVGVSNATISRWETGVITNQRRDKLELLATALKTTPAELMGWEAEEKLILLKEEELNEINAIFLALNSDNRAKLLELGRLFLGAQRNSGEN